MASYSIKKISNGEYKEVTKKFKLNVNKYIGDSSTLYFDVEGQENPFLMDFGLFFNIINEQIQNGLVEDLTFDNKAINIIIRDGNKIKKYSYDFSFDDFVYNLANSKLSELKSSVYKIVSLYEENPNSSITSEQKYMRLIYNILDGDRIPVINNENELLRIFEVYHAHKHEFLESLLDNVVFYDDNGNVLEYKPYLRDKKIDLIKYDVLHQMEISMLLFVQENNAGELYRNYLENTFIPRREVVYKYYDENGNEIEAPQEVESGTIFSLGREFIEQGLDNIREFASSGINKVLKRTRKK